MMDEDYVEFNKLNEDRIIGTKAETATIYDIESKILIQTLKPSLSNQYIKNRATFCPTNELVLSDGVLWDVNSGKEIHKFDKLNQTLSGVFHPNGLEVISNTEVWDLRTFHLLRTVPTLDQCEVLFSPTGYVIYSLTIEKESEDENQYEHSFRTLDAYDYSSIVTIDVKKNIYDLACNGRDTQIALVENQGMFDSVQESIVKIYDVGRSRTAEDEPEDDDEDEELDASSGSDDDQNNGMGIIDEVLEHLDELDSIEDEQQDENTDSMHIDDDSGDGHDDVDINSARMLIDDTGDENDENIWP